MDDNVGVLRIGEGLLVVFLLFEVSEQIVIVEYILIEYEIIIIVVFYVGEEVLNMNVGGYLQCEV